MVEDLTSSGPWASLYIHWDSLAKWHTRQHQDSWQFPWQQLEKPLQGLKRRAALLPGQNHTPALGWLMNIPPALSKSLPFTLTLLEIWCLHLNGVDYLICELGSCFSILWPLNKACAVSASASVSFLAVQISLGKEPLWPRWGPLGWARTPVQVRSTRPIW